MPENQGKAARGRYVGQPFEKMFDRLADLQMRPFAEAMDRILEMQAAPYARLADRMLELQASPYADLADRMLELQSAPYARLADRMLELQSAPYARLSDRMLELQAAPYADLADRILELQAAPYAGLADRILELESAPIGRVGEKLQEIVSREFTLRVPAVDELIDNIARSSSIADLIEHIDSTDLLDDAGAAEPTDIDAEALTHWLRGVLHGLVVVGGPILALQVLLIIWALLAEVDPNLRTKFAEVATLVGLAIASAPRFKTIATSIVPPTNNPPD